MAFTLVLSGCAECGYGGHTERHRIVAGGDGGGDEDGDLVAPCGSCHFERHHLGGFHGLTVEDWLTLPAGWWVAATTHLRPGAFPGVQARWAETRGLAQTVARETVAAAEGRR